MKNNKERKTSNPEFKFLKRITKKDKAPNLSIFRSHNFENQEILTNINSLEKEFPRRFSYKERDSLKNQIANYNLYEENLN